MHAIFLLLVLAAALPSPDLTAVEYVLSLSGTEVGRVAVEHSGDVFVYRSDAWVRRGPVTTRNSAQARARLAPEGAILSLESERREGGLGVEWVAVRREEGRLVVTVRRLGAEPRTAFASLGTVPASLAFQRLRELGPGCLEVLDETSGRIGRACAERILPRLEGTLLGEPFIVEPGESWPRRIELPGQGAVFVRSAPSRVALAPPDLYGAGIASVGLEGKEEAASLRVILRAGAPLALPDSASQAATSTADGARVTWKSAAPKRSQARRKTGRLGGAFDAALADALAARPGDRWRAAQALAAFVDGHIEDKRPGVGERSAEAVLAHRRGTCVAHAALFLELARRAGVPARPAVGLVAAEGRFWAHEWAQVEVGGAWYDLDPTEGGPASAARILLVAGDAAREPAAARLLLRAPGLRIEVVGEGLR